MPDTQPDYWNTTLRDGGPLYVETNLDRAIVEPCNALTASLFVVIVGIWLWRMRANYRQHPFTLLCMPILLIGGIGGTLFHAFRAHKAFFLMDVGPIVLLVMLGSIYLWIRLRPRIWHVLILVALIMLISMPFASTAITHHVAIVSHYAALAMLILIPVAIVLYRTRFRHFNLVKLTAVLFCIALLFRFLDARSANTLPGLGTHWLWHIFGAATTATLAEYFFRIETEPIAPRVEA